MYCSAYKLKFNIWSSPCIPKGDDIAPKGTQMVLGMKKILLCIKSAAAAKSLQSCPTLCDPRDGSPPGSPVPGIFQARTLAWVAISFPNAWKSCIFSIWELFMLLIFSTVDLLYLYVVSSSHFKCNVLRNQKAVHTSLVKEEQQ